MNQITDTLQAYIEAFALATEREWHPERYGITPSEFPTASSEWGATEWLYVFYVIFALYGFAAAIIDTIKKRKKNKE
jgi:hypothetical protein